ncbi:MAG TPA: hypothetical protein VL093_14680 [Flavipsychrobacter sp.]|nr:hypothetical protein [Flavipsychrobacter sp.]
MFALKTKKQLRVNPWVALLLIILLSFLGMNEVFETNLWVKQHLLIKYSLYVIWIIMIAVVGFISLKTFPLPWISKLWAVVYFLALTLLLVLGLADFVFHFPYAWKKDANQLRTLFMSPLPFALCLLFSRLNIRK